MTDKKVLLVGETLGYFLKRHRIKSNISLDDISKKTRIRKVLLEKIENDECDELPCHPYNSSFVKMYARFIGLDAEAIGKEFKSLLSRKTASR